MQNGTHLNVTAPTLLAGGVHVILTSLFGSLFICVAASLSLVHLIVLVPVGAFENVPTKVLSAFLASNKNPLKTAPEIVTKIRISDMYSTFCNRKCL